jgi:ATP phosphoribosyltransferase regulatory subunit
VGLTNISFDLTMPQLVLRLLDDVPEPDRAALARALDRKDTAAVAALGTARTDLLVQLLEAAGPAARAIPALLAISLPEAARDMAMRLAETVSAIQSRNPALALTADPVEFRGYQYHTGICFTVFATGRQAELGRGGRYLCDTEPATGITLYPDTIVQVAPPVTLRPRLYLPHGTPLAQAEALRRQNFATIAGLGPAVVLDVEALRLGCTHVLRDGEAVAVSKDTI